jgi:hypothetical protein
MLVEPIATVTFSDVPNEAFRALGMRKYWDGYFAGRAAPLGLAPAYDILSATELDELIAGLEPIAAWPGSKTSCGSCNMSAWLRPPCISLIGTTAKVPRVLDIDADHFDSDLAVDPVAVRVPSTLSVWKLGSSASGGAGTA